MSTDLATKLCGWVFFELWGWPDELRPSRATEFRRRALMRELGLGDLVLSDPPARVRAGRNGATDPGEPREADSPAAQLRR